MQQRVSIITLGVADVAIAGFSRATRLHVALEMEETVFFELGDSLLVLWGRDSGGGQRRGRRRRLG